MSEISNGIPKFTEQPLLSSPDLREFPTTLDMSEDNNFIRFRAVTDGGTVDGSISKGSPGDPNYGKVEGSRLNINNVEVNEAHRGKGIATDLLRTFSREMAERGVTSIGSVIVSPIAMRNRARVYGPGKTNMYEIGAGMDPIPVSDAQAAASLERIVAREKVRESLGKNYQANPIESRAWHASVNLKDHEVIDYLNKPLQPWEKILRIVPEDERHYPESWDADLAAFQQAAAAEAIEPATARPSLTERFRSIGRGLQEKAHAWRRKITLTAGVGATALALLSSSQVPVEHIGNTPVAVEAASELPTPETRAAHHLSNEDRQSKNENIILGAWNPATGEGSLYGAAEAKLTHNLGRAASAEDIMNYAEQIRTANQIDEPLHLQPGQRIVLPTYQKPAPKS